MAVQLPLGQTLGFSGDPFDGPWQEVSKHSARGAVLIDRGRIVAVGQADDLRRHYPAVPVTDYGSDLISPGFVDAQMHYPQTGIIASWGKRLIDWLSTYTFPEELRLADPATAATIAALSLDLAAAHGTTTQASFLYQPSGQHGCLYQRRCGA